MHGCHDFAARRPKPRPRRHARASERLGACPAQEGAAMPAAPALRGIDLGMVGTIGERHRALLATGEIERDPGQESVVAKLAALEARLERHRLAQKSSSLGWLFGRGAASRGPVEGLYLHGEVGRGKTMLMDLFFASAAIAR